MEEIQETVLIQSVPLNLYMKWVAEQEQNLNHMIPGQVLYCMTPVFIHMPDTVLGTKLKRQTQ